MCMGCSFTKITHGCELVIKSNQCNHLELMEPHWATITRAILVTSLVTPWIRKSRSFDWIGSICLSSGCQQLLQRTATSCLFIDLWKWSFFSHSTSLLLSPKTINSSAGVFWAVTHFWATFVGSFFTFGLNYCYGRVAFGRGIWLDPKISCNTWRIWWKQIHHNHATMIISLHLNWLRLIGNLWHQWHRHRQQLIPLSRFQVQPY